MEAKVTTSPASQRRAISAVLALLLLVNLTQSLYSLPLNRVIERRLCHEYYERHDPSVIGGEGEIEEELCKVDEVQKGLAWLQGVMETTWIVGDFIVTIPLGFIAETYGRRFILWLNLIPRAFMLIWAVCVGYFSTALPTKAIIASPFLSVLGGNCVFESIVFALAGAISSDPATRASYFSYMTSINYVVALLGPSLASATMSALLWLPFWIGMVLLAGAAIVISFLPDGIDPSKKRIQAEERREEGIARDEEEASPLLQPYDDSTPRSASRTTKTTAHNRNRLTAEFHTILRLSRSKVASIHTLLLSNRNLSLLIVTMVLTSAASADTKLLPQYISKKFHWKFASSGYLISLKAIVNFTLLTLIVPGIIRHYAAKSKGMRDTIGFNITACQILLALSVLGAAAIAAAPTVGVLVPAMFVYAMGSALPVFKLSLLVAFGTSSGSMGRARKSSSSSSSSSPLFSSAPVHDVGDDVPVSLASSLDPQVRPRSRSPGPLSSQDHQLQQQQQEGRAGDTIGSKSESHTFLYSIAMLLKTVGSLIGAPISAALWFSGISKGGAALGLPYFVSAAMYLVGMGVLALLRY